MQQLENKLGYVFKNKALLREALTHSSYANENKKKKLNNNERLEFLGDSILGVTVAEFLYKTHPEMREGQMTRLRAELVCEAYLASVAEEIGLGDKLLLGRGEETGGGRKRPSITADAVEAIIAAVYLDSDFSEAVKLIYRFIIDPYREGKKSTVSDYKTELQEFIQRKSGQILTYEMKESIGPDHDKKFVYYALINGEIVGMGVGRTKKEAEQAAAGDALKRL